MNYKDKIVTYLRFKRRGNNANKLERDAMHDAFLSDALDGYDTVDNEEQLLADIAYLQTQLNSRSYKRKLNVRLIAAVIAFCLLSGVGYWALKTETEPTDKPLLTERTKIKDFVKDTNTQASPPITIIETASDVKDNEQLAGVVSQPKLTKEELTPELYDVAVIASVAESSTIYDYVIQDTQQIQQMPTPAVDPLFNKYKNEINNENKAYTDAFYSRKETESDNSSIGAGQLALSLPEADKPTDSYKFRGKSKDRKYSSNNQMMSSMDVSNELLAVTGKTISGTIREGGSDEILPYASVRVKGSNIATVSDIDGNFALQLPVGMDSVTLEFSFVGYESLAKTINNATSVAVALSPSSPALDEVIVIGLGAYKKADIASSSSLILKDAVKPNGQVHGDLAGSVSGLQIATSEETGKVEIRLIGKQGTNPIIGQRAYKDKLESMLLAFHKHTSASSQLVGSVKVSFMLDTNGLPADITLVEGIGSAYDNKVIEAVKSLGAWTIPEKQLDKSIVIRVYFSK